ncbi:MAG: permease [Gammaproteobacteria bacterium]|nr:permease [Gammaproteobacteria bacterium]HAJ06051.1 permease [Chloroflexota bacterium]
MQPLLKRISQMVTPTLIMGIIALLMLFFGYQQGNNQHIEGLKVTLVMIKQMMPLLVLALVIAGMAQVLSSQQQEFIDKWLGPESGMRGILIASAAGTLTPGGPVVTVPILAGLLRSGSSVGVAVAYLTGWGAWSLARLPLEIAILGWKFTVIRVLSVCLLPPLAGLIAQTFFAKTL